MEFLNQNMQLIVTAAVILVVLLIVAAVWRTVGNRMSGRRGQRLGISEYYELDKSRRLVLVRRDNVEHLILIGGPQDVVIEPAIQAAAYAPSAYASQHPYAEPPGMARPAPRAPVFAEKKAPPPLRPAPEPQAPVSPMRPPRDEPGL